MTRDEVKSLPLRTKIWCNEAGGTISIRPDPDCTQVVWNNGAVDYVYHDEDRKFCGMDTTMLSREPGTPALFASVPTQGAPYLAPTGRKPKVAVEAYPDHLIGVNWPAHDEAGLVDMVTGKVVMKVGGTFGATFYCYQVDITNRDFQMLADDPANQQGLSRQHYQTWDNVPALLAHPSFLLNVRRRKRFEVPLATIGITPAYVATAIVYAGSKREAEQNALGLDFGDVTWTDESGKEEFWSELGDPQVVVAIQ